MFTAVAPAVSQATKLFSRLVSQIIWLISWFIVLKDLSGGTDGTIWVYKQSQRCNFQAAQRKDSKCNFLVCQECLLVPLTSNPPLFSIMSSTHHLSNLLYDKTLERAHSCLVLDFRPSSYCESKQQCLSAEFSHRLSRTPFALKLTANVQ